MYKADEYGELINHSDTYREIAMVLGMSKSVIIGWTDEEMTHFDIMFTLSPIRFGNLQRGLRGAGELYISVIGIGCFGFTLSDPNERHPGYIAEKITANRMNLGSTADKLAELINGVIDEVSA